MQAVLKITRFHRNSVNIYAQFLLTDICQERVKKFNISLPSMKLLQPELIKNGLRNQPTFHIFKDNKIR